METAPSTGAPTHVGIRRALTTGRLRTAAEVQLGGTLPLGARDLAPEPDVVWQPAVATASASGALQLGYGFGKNWVSAEVGYRWKSALADTVFGSLQVGRQGERVVVDVHVPFAWSLTRLEAPVNYMGTGDTQYIGLGIGVGWWLTDHVGIATGFEAVALARANAAGLTLPLYVQFR